MCLHIEIKNLDHLGKKMNLTELGDLERLPCIILSEEKIQNIVYNILSLV